MVGPLNMFFVNIDQNLYMINMELDTVKLWGAHVGGEVNLSFSKNPRVYQRPRVGLLMDRLQVGQTLSMSGAEFGPVDLPNAHVGGQLNLNGASVYGTLNMDAIHIDQSLIMGDGRFDDIVLRYANIGGQISLRGSEVSGSLEMASLHVDQDLLMDHSGNPNKTVFHNVDLLGARVGGQLSMSHAKFDGKLNLVSLQVGTSIYANDAEFNAPVEFYFGKVGDALELSGITFKSTVDLTGTQIGGELGLGWSTHSPHWSKDSALILRDVNAGALQDLSDAWPDKLDLNGFIYRSLGGVRAAEGDLMINRPGKWFKKWLAKQSPYAPGPYQQLASVLRNQGQPDIADDVLFAGRERERGEACVSWSRADSCLWLSILSSAAGYGIGLYTFRVLWWVVGLTVLGAFILWFSPNARRHGPLWIAGASLHRLLPIVELSKGFTKFFENSTTSESWRRNLHPFQEVYFALHALLGWALGLILLAAMAGLIQKS